MSKTVSLKNLRPNLPKIIQEVDERMERFVITKYGRPLAVLISPDDLDGLIETIDILQNKTLMRRIRKAETDFKAGRTHSLEEVRRSLDRV